MERRTFSKAQIYVRETYNRANQAAAKGDYCRAVELLVPVAKLNPEVPQIFDKLREYEIIKTRGQNPMIKTLSVVWSLFIIPFVYILAFIDPEKALAICENQLAVNVDNPLLLGALAFAANTCEAPWIAVTARQVVKAFHPENEANLKALALDMQKNGQARLSLKILKEIAKRHPGDLSMQNEIREAMALASIEHGKWEDEGATQDKAADAKDAVLQQLLDGTIHDTEQATMLIEKFTEDLKVADSLDIRRKLAEAYMVAEKYEEALEQYRTVSDALGVLDPVLDKQIEKAYISGLQQSVTELKNNPQNYTDAEEQIASIQKEIDDYRRRHVIKRATMFPNDMQMQYDLAVFYFDEKNIDEAEEIFIKLSKNPQKQRDAWIYLGQCALLKNTPEAAIKWLDRAVKELYRMDKYKREALYYLGIAYERSGRTAEAVECFQMVYCNINDYRDVAQRIRDLGAEPGVIEKQEAEAED
jgi:tetratricopeptide (TPR) repeat protein